MDIVAGVFLVIGSGFVLLASIGVVRFHDTYSRMHSAAKGPALGIICLGVGAALAIRTPQATIAVLLVIVLQLIAGPVSTHVLGRSVYLRDRPDLQAPDELESVELDTREDRRNRSD